MRPFNQGVDGVANGRVYAEQLNQVLNRVADVANDVHVPKRQQQGLPGVLAIAAVSEDAAGNELAEDEEDRQRETLVRTSCNMAWTPSTLSNALEGEAV